MQVLRHGATTKEEEERLMNAKPGKAEFTVRGACLECMCMGLFTSESVRHGLQVERCDNCSVFAGDDEARGHALRLAVQALKKPRRRRGKRFKVLLECLETMANQEGPPFWAKKPSAKTLQGAVRFLHGKTSGEVTLLSVAYLLQGTFIHCPTNGENAEFDNEYARDNLDRDELEKMLRDAGCECRESAGVEHWSVGMKVAWFPAASQSRDRWRGEI